MCVNMNMYMSFCSKANHGAKANLSSSKTGEERPPKRSNITQSNNVKSPRPKKDGVYGGLSENIVDISEVFFLNLS